MNINTLALYDLPQWIDDKTINFKCADSRCRAKINFIIKDGGKWEMISEAFILHQCTFIGSLKGEYRFLMVEESSNHKAYFFDEPTLWSMNALKKVGQKGATLPTNCCLYDFNTSEEEVKMTKIQF